MLNVHFWGDIENGTKPYGYAVFYSYDSYYSYEMKYMISSKGLCKYDAGQ